MQLETLGCSADGNDLVFFWGGSAIVGASPVWSVVSIFSTGLKHGADSQREKILSKIWLDLDLQ